MVKDFLVEDSSPGVRSEKPNKELQLGGRESRSFQERLSISILVNTEREKGTWNVFAEEVTAENA